MREWLSVCCFVWAVLIGCAGPLDARALLERRSDEHAEPTWLVGAENGNDAGIDDGPNLYAYVRQNPWTLFDPEGLNPYTKEEMRGPRFEDVGGGGVGGSGVGGRGRGDGVGYAAGTGPRIRASSPGTSVTTSPKPPAASTSTPRTSTSGASSNAKAGGPPVAEAEPIAGGQKIEGSAKRTLEQNKKIGAAHEKVVGDKVQVEQTDVKGQVTLETESGTRTKIDFVGKIEGQPKLTEAKGTETAPLTPNQKKAFPEIEQSGATVRGKNGGEAFPPGTMIPPTKVDIVRPKDLPEKP